MCTKRTGVGSGVTTKLFGEPVRRREDQRLITGRGRYLDGGRAHGPRARVGGTERSRREGDRTVAAVGK